MDYALLEIYTYLPGQFIPEDMFDMEFEELFRLKALAEEARRMKLDDMKEAVNAGVALLFDE